MTSIEKAARERRLRRIKSEVDRGAYVADPEAVAAALIEAGVIEVPNRRRRPRLAADDEAWGSFVAIAPATVALVLASPLGRALAS